MAFALMAFQAGTKKDLDLEWVVVKISIHSSTWTKCVSKETMACGPVSLCHHANIPCLLSRNQTQVPNTIGHSGKSQQTITTSLMNCGMT